MSSTTQHPTTDKIREAGMVSIMVSLILMIVLSLIVLGFAQVARRNERETLDRQLSTQAFYAAETGINDVRNFIKSAGGAVPAKPNCPNTGAYSALPASSLNGPNNVSYTCVLVDPTPNVLSFTNVGGNPSGTPSGTGIIVPLTTSSNISSLTFTWFTTDTTNIHPATGCPAGATRVFSDTASWSCGYGVLRFDLVPTSGGLTAAGLQAGTMSSFVVPQSAGSVASAVNFATNGSRDLIGTKCSDANCTMTINSGLGGSQYYLRVTTLYKPVGLQISAKDSSGTAVNFQGAQAVVDATGKAQDVLRRVQVRVPLTASSTNQIGNYALETSDSICKRFAVMDGYFASKAASVVSGMETSVPVNPLCQ